MHLQGQRVLVVGMAASGMAASLFLRQKGARVVVSEARAAEALRAEISQLLDAGVAIETGGHRERSFLDTDMIVVSPGVPMGLPILQRARAERIPIIGEVELASRFLPGTIVAITGANGKTTTTSLAAELISACGYHTQVGGNIGRPLISLVNSAMPETINVVEVSSFQLETVESFHPHIAAVLNLSPDHLDRHGSMAAYAAAKGRIFGRQDVADFAILNAQDPWCRDYAVQTRGQVRWFGSAETEGPGCRRQDDALVWVEGKQQWRLLSLAEIPLRGAHNVENVQAALAIVCSLTRLSTQTPAEQARLIGTMAEAVRRFKAVEHRLEFVANVRGVDYYNDSKATNVDATAKALEAFPAGLWVILGGKDKGSDYTTLIPLLKERARSVLLIGAATEKIAGHLASGGIEAVRAGTLERAMSMVAAEAQAGDTVLLAPACASFDQFDNYEHRGRVFKQLVAQLAVPAVPPASGAAGG